MASAKDEDVCWNCRLYQEIAYTESGTGRTFCKPCALQLPPTSEELALLFIEATCPFRVGDRVEARTAGEVYDGVGEVEEISTDLRHGGTRVYPAFRVKLETREHELAPEEAWYTEVCLKKVAA